MNNPFEREHSLYHVLQNEEGQYSLWPAAIAVPAGWNTVLTKEKRITCLDYIGSHWLDLRPKSLHESILVHEAGR